MSDKHNKPRANKEIVEIIKVVLQEIIFSDVTKIGPLFIHYPAIRECLMELMELRAVIGGRALGESCTMSDSTYEIPHTTPVDDATPVDDRAQGHR